MHGVNKQSFEIIAHLQVSRHWLFNWILTTAWRRIRWLGYHRISVIYIYTLATLLYISETRIKSPTHSANRVIGIALPLVSPPAPAGRHRCLLRPHANRILSKGGLPAPCCLLFPQGPHTTPPRGLPDTCREFFLALCAPVRSHLPNHRPFYTLYKSVARFSESMPRPCLPLRSPR